MVCVPLISRQHALRRISAGKHSELTQNDSRQLPFTDDFLFRLLFRIKQNIFYQGKKGHSK